MADFINVQLKDICNFEKGVTGLAKAVPGEYPMVTTGAERRTCESFQFDTKAVCIPLVSSTGHGHASLKNVHYQEGKFALGTILVALTAQNDNELDIQFLHLYLSQLKDVVLVPLMSGAANVALSVTKIKNIQIPLPSIDSQKEIVTQFKSIVAEEGQLKVELTHQQTLLKKLRQQILQEAIEGKLTADWREQNPDVEPASELLARIKAEKEQLIRDKKIKKQKALPPITDEEKPFNLPDGWVWCRLDDLCNTITKGSSPKWQGVNYVDSYEKGILFITSKNVDNYKVDLSNVTFVEKSFNDIEPRSILKKGDLLTNIVGASIGRTAIYNLDYTANINQAVCILRIEHEYILKTFMLKIMNADFIIQLMLDMQFSPGRANLSMSNLARFPIALPPLAEQKSIVDKVEKLFAICDQLETQITNNQTHADQLMQAVLKEAFQQNNNDELADTEG